MKVYKLNMWSRIKIECLEAEKTTEKTVTFLNGRDEPVRYNKTSRFEMYFETKEEVIEYLNSEIKRSEQQFALEVERVNNAFAELEKMP